MLNFVFWMSQNSDPRKNRKCGQDMGNMLEKAMGHILRIHLPISCGHVCQCAQLKLSPRYYQFFTNTYESKNIYFLIF